jgi:hypothetical protein
MPGYTIGPLRLIADGNSFSADVHDMSIIGIGLIVNVPFPDGSYFIVESGPKGRKLTNRLTAELRHTTERADGRLLLGCSLSRHLIAEDFEILG